MATGCSTNAVVHLLAMARRGRVPLTLDDLDALGRTTPLIANVRPSGKGYLMEDFFYAGGLLRADEQHPARSSTSRASPSPARPSARRSRGRRSTMTTSSGRSSNPVYHEGSLAVLKGNLAPDGAVIKPAACDPKFHVHEGPAMVFDSYPEMKAFVDDEASDVTADHVHGAAQRRAARRAGDAGVGHAAAAEGAGEAGPSRHAAASPTRACRARAMAPACCTSRPRAFVGGPLALLRTGDIVRCDVPDRRIDMLVAESEIEARRSNWTAPEPRFERGYGWVFAQHVGQADKGCDFDYLAPGVRQGRRRAGHLLERLLEGPDHRHEADGDDEEPEHHRQAELPVVAEAVAAGLHHHQIRRGGHRGQEGRRRGDGDAHQHRLRRDAHAARGHHRDRDDDQRGGGVADDLAEDAGQQKSPARSARGPKSPTRWMSASASSFAAPVWVIAVESGIIAPTRITVVQSIGAVDLLGVEDAEEQDRAGGEQAGRRRAAPGRSRAGAPSPP